MNVPSKFVLFECANTDYLIRDVENEKFLNRYEEVELLNDLLAENKYLLDMLSSTYNKPRISFSLIHKMKKLEEENWRLKKILALNAIDYNSQQYDNLDYNSQ